MRRRTRRFAIAVLTMLLAGGTIAGCARLAPNIQDRVIDAKNAVAPALVHIRPVKEVFVSGKRT